MKLKSLFTYYWLYKKNRGENMIGHKELDLTDYRNVYFIGDTHGDYDLVWFALKTLGFDDKDFLICTGDHVDRGDKIFEMLSFVLYTPNVESVMGNHEDMMIQSLINKDNRYGACWMQNGGTWALNHSFSMLAGMAKVIEEKFPIALTIKRGDVTVGVCHGESPLPRWTDYTALAGKTYQYDQTALWGREKIDQPEDEAIKGVTFTVHGHSVRPRPTEIANQYWIDTGSVFDNGSGKYGLTISELKGDKLVHYRFYRDGNEFKMEDPE